MHDVTMTRSATDPVGQDRARDGTDGEHERADDAEGQDGRSAVGEAIGVGTVARQECGAGVEEGEEHHGRCSPEQNLARLLAHDFPDRELSGYRGGTHGIRCRLEDGGLFDLEPNVEADDHEYRAQNERDAPAEAEERLGGITEGQIDDQESQAGQGEADRWAELRKCGVQATTLRRGIFGGEECRSGPLATNREALQKSQQHENDRSGKTDHARAGQQTDRNGRDPHDEQRADQGLLAAEPVPEMTEQNGAQRTGHERDGKRSKRRERAGTGAQLGKKTCGNTSAAAVP